MNSLIRNLILYLKMTMLFTILGATVLYIGGSPVATYIIGKGNMLMYQGAPVDLKTDTSDVSLLIEEGDHPNQSEDRVVVQKARIGTIECQRIALSAPLYDNDSDALLLQGVGHYPESGLPGEGVPILISGHDTTYFAPLERIGVGDIVRIVMEDQDYYYGIVMTKIADKSDVSAYDLTQDEERLILYTCYPFGQMLGTRNERYFVYGERLQEDTVLPQE